MLAALESRRYLEINEGIFKLSLNQQLSRLSDFIKTHNQQHPVLELWGKIESYVYFYDEKTIFIFSTTGELVDSQTKYSYSKAVLSLR